MTTQESKNPLKHLRASDMRGLAQLASQATEGVTGITEGVHLSVLATIGLPGAVEEGRTRGITGIVYSSVRMATRILGKGVDITLGAMQPLFDLFESDKPETPRREAVLAALNGVMGDRLLANDNPFAIAMSLRRQGQALNPDSIRSLPGVTGKIALMMHGLCMSDLQWSARDKTPGTDHAQALASRLGYTPVYLRSHSRMHLSQNGRELAEQLEKLLAHWPSTIDELTVVAHSMGGLVIRSAIYYAQEQDMAWPSLLKNIVFLGTPHHGAPLEKVGNWVDALMGSTPFTRPFNALGKIRSAGITDLRFGNILDEDWQGTDRFNLTGDQRKAVQLPEKVRCFCIAATTTEKRGALADRLIGDGLVPVNSALGSHGKAHKAIAFDSEKQWITYHTNHMELLSRPEVTRKILEWLTPG
jgi:pimeloyl-ACP methyl ester carboxylesterase